MFCKIIGKIIRLFNFSAQQLSAKYLNSGNEADKNIFLLGLMFSIDSQAKDYLQKIVQSEPQAEIFVRNKILQISQKNKKKALALSFRLFGCSFWEWYFNPENITVDALQKHRKLKESQLSPQDFSASYFPE